MVNDTFKKDIAKFVEKSTVSTELPPGSPRRYEPNVGLAKHNKRIHTESAYADKYKNLPFTFSKPEKSKPLKLKLCGNCEQEVFVHKNCVGIVCRHCGKYSPIKEVEING